MISIGADKEERRWCRYVHLFYNRQAPGSYLSYKPYRVRLLSITMLLHPPRKWLKPLTSVLVGSKGGAGRAWTSIARYDDNYVAELTARVSEDPGVSRPVCVGGVGGDGKYDATKMFRSCGKMVHQELDQRDAAFLPKDFNVS